MISFPFLPPFSFRLFIAKNQSSMVFGSFESSRLISFLFPAFSAQPNRPHINPHEDTPPFSARPNDTIYMIKSNPMKIFLFLHFLHIQTDPKYRLKPTPWRYFFSYVFLPNQTDPICIQSNPMKLFPFAFPLLMNNNEDITSSSREMKKFTAKTSGLLCFYKFPCFHGAKPVYICFFIFISGYIFGSYRRATTLTLKSIKYMVL